MARKKSKNKRENKLQPFKEKFNILGIINKIDQEYLKEEINSKNEHQTLDQDNTNIEIWKKKFDD
ncbi:hypothetical protein H8356DRAFT_1349024 [Neocallimastix lanati (nom. inval.)]|nr:hypothetical protein H8356DRAFT_1349024 [Neocallimastix sp. JGI-2020a]